MSEPAVTRIDAQPGLIVVHVLSDRLNETNLPEIRSDVAAAGATAPDAVVVLDMSQVTFLTSLSLGELLTLSREFSRKGQRLVLVGVQPQVMETVKLTHLDRLFEIREKISDL